MCCDHRRYPDHSYSTGPGGPESRKRMESFHPVFWSDVGWVVGGVRKTVRLLSFRRGNMYFLKIKSVSLSHSSNLMEQLTTSDTVRILNTCTCRACLFGLGRFPASHRIACRRMKEGLRTRLTTGHLIKKHCRQVEPQLHLR